jgi:hypothetical protein
LGFRPSILPASGYCNRHRPRLSAALASPRLQIPPHPKPSSPRTRNKENPLVEKQFSKRKALVLPVEKQFLKLKALILPVEKVFSKLKALILPVEKQFLKRKALVLPVEKQFLK